MGTRDPRVDAYIENAPPYARPILSSFREAIHTACPEVSETLRWRAPSFDHHGILCNIAAFKAYAGVMFWKGALIPGAEEKLGRIEKAADLPPRKEMVALFKAAARLNEAGEKVPKAPKAKKPPPKMPAQLAASLKKNARARAAFDGLSPSHQREYVEWIAGARRDETRHARVAKALAQLVEGKSLNWKYQR